MTSVCGHVMSLDFLGKYNNWDKVDPVSVQLINYFDNLYLIFLNYNIFVGRVIFVPD